MVDSVFWKIKREIGKTMRIIRARKLLFVAPISNIVLRVLKVPFFLRMCGWDKRNLHLLLTGAIVTEI